MGRHFVVFIEGIGLRQVLDYYFVLRALHIEQGELFDRSNGSCAPVAAQVWRNMELWR